MNEFNFRFSRKKFNVIEIIFGDVMRVQIQKMEPTDETGVFEYFPYFFQCERH